MRNFVIFVQGENYNLEVEGKVQLAGFFATRRAEALTEDEASAIVINQLKSDSDLNLSPIKDLNIESSITVKVIHEMPIEHKNTYTVFHTYPMDV